MDDEVHGDDDRDELISGRGGEIETRVVRLTE